MKINLTFGDLFAGGGGTSTGALCVKGINVLWALNHDPIAIKLHKANHPETKHFHEDLYTKGLELKLEPVDILWASLECTQHSKAKGGGNKKVGSFMLGHELYRYIKTLDPIYIMIENVPEFLYWSEVDKHGKIIPGTKGKEYEKWHNQIIGMGWSNYDYQVLNSADYGAPTRRSRYFGIFSKPDFPVVFPEQTHTKKSNDLFYKPWRPCKKHIDLSNEGQSIFGRTFNENLPKNVRRPLVHNTLKRIAGGIKKFSPKQYFIMKYYGSGLNCSDIEKPLDTVTVKDRHALIKLEKLHFIADHCHTDNYNTLNEPLNPQLTRQTKQLLTVNSCFLNDYYGRHDTAQSIKKPTSTITCANSKNLVTIKTNFVSAQYNSNGNPAANNFNINEPLHAITTREKFQFVSLYFNSSGHPETQNQSLSLPLNCITTGTNKQALITLLNSFIDFDIKMRFLTPDELAAIMGFPPGYFNTIKLSKKQKVKMIGNAVQVDMARLLINEIVKTLNTDPYRELIA